MYLNRKLTRTNPNTMFGLREDISVLNLNQNQKYDVKNKPQDKIGPEKLYIIFLV